MTLESEITVARVRIVDLLADDQGPAFMRSVSPDRIEACLRADHELTGRLPSEEECSALVEPEDDEGASVEETFPNTFALISQLF